VRTILGIRWADNAVAAAAGLVIGLLAQRRTRG
jgi:ElaB/YqjD/DUF883 family membrane-anchored ribosome-binding protein